jgi:hypothetical protein
MVSAWQALTFVTLAFRVANLCPLLGFCAANSISVLRDAGLVYSAHALDIFGLHPIKQSVEIPPFTAGCGKREEVSPTSAYHSDHSGTK